MKPLIRHNVFQMCTQVDGSRLKEEKPASAAEIFQQAADAIYGWIVGKYGGHRRPVLIMLTFWLIM